LTIIKYLLDTLVKILKNIPDIYFRGRNFLIFAKFRLNRESLIPRKISKAVIR